MSLRQIQGVPTTSEKVNKCLNDGDCIIPLVMCKYCFERFHK